MTLTDRHTLPTFYFIGGYANSGKSTLIAKLEQNFNILVVSTSTEVHLQYRLAHDGVDLDTKQPHLRQQFIDWVEEVYLPSIGGREVFASKVISKAVDFGSKYSAVVVETVGGKEFDSMMGTMPYDTPYRLYNCNRDDSAPGADLRIPLDGANDLDCNNPWEPWEYRSWFPELVPRLILPIPDAISGQLGNRIEHSCLSVLPDSNGATIYSMTGQIKQIDGIDCPPLVDIDEPTLEKILTNLVQLRSGSFEWGCTKIKISRTGKISLIKLGETLGISSVCFFSKYLEAMEIFGYPMGCKYRETPIISPAPAPALPETPPGTDTDTGTGFAGNPVAAREGLVGNIQLSRQIVAQF